ncbi:MAG: NAD(P)-dependent oxidoreductase [Gammaproteobacteria bacterium]|nr:NAD(P)-dependent oxidoreductase [Gammaproteobacteria bacterium]MDH3411371.1 NAD(P)-dependent oxidoreductase [Gammaproteobacteria bacterium]
MSEKLFGFIGLGNMGRHMAANLEKNGTRLVVFDKAGTAARAPEGATQAGSAAEVASRAETVFLCLPDGNVVGEVIAEILGSGSGTLRRVVDTSTIGIAAAEEGFEACRQAGIEYVDSPISGGVAGAQNATLAVMYAGTQETFDGLRPVYLGMAKNVFKVGDRSGQGQAMKLLNNFLSGTAMAATSEAVAFGVGQGLDMKTMLEVLNVSTGQNTATKDKFPNRILGESYDAGFLTRLFYKDISLYRQAVTAAGAADPVSPAVAALWKKLNQADDNADFTRIYPFVRDKKYR